MHEKKLQKYLLTYNKNNVQYYNHRNETVVNLKETLLLTKVKLHLFAITTLKKKYICKVYFLYDSINSRCVNYLNIGEIYSNISIKEINNGQLLCQQYYRESLLVALC